MQQTFREFHVTWYRIFSVGLFTSFFHTPNGVCICNCMLQMIYTVTSGDNDQN